MPALPLDEAGKYVAAAYVVFFMLVVIYVAIIGAKIARIDRELGELAELADRDRKAADAVPAATEEAVTPKAEPAPTEPPRDEEPVA